MFKRIVVILWLPRSLSARSGQQPSAGQQPAYLNPALPLDQRVDDLVSRMTNEEKASQFSSTSPAIPRLQIRHTTGGARRSTGVANQGIATVFPQAIGLAATFDEPLIYQMATVISTEARAKFHEYQRKETRRLQPEPICPEAAWAFARGRPVSITGLPHQHIPRSALGQRPGNYGETPSSTGRLGTAFVRVCREMIRNTSRRSPHPNTTLCTAAPNRRDIRST